jgi:hypothetical protein
MSNHEIKWNKNRHDERVTKHDEEVAKAKAMKLFAKHYQSWRAQFRKKDGMSVEELKNKILDLRNLVMTEVEGAGLGPWKEFSTKLLDEKLLEIETVLIAARNRIVQYIPVLPGVAETIQSNLPTPLQTEEQKRGAVEAFFQTEEQMRAIPWIKSVADKEGFMGFCLDGHKLVGMFDDGEIVPIGVVSCGTGLERVPSLHDFATALKGTLDAASAAAPSEPAGELGRPTAQRRRTRPPG